METDTRVVEEIEVVVQHDWFQSLSSQPHKFFIGFRRSGAKKISFFDAIVSPKDGSIEVSFTNEIFAQVKGRCLLVGLNSGEQLYFIAPLVEFGDIHKASIQTIDVTPSGSMMLTSDSYGTLRVSSTSDGRPLRELEGHALHLSTAKLFPSGLVVLAGGADMQLRIWSIETAEIARTFKGHQMALTDAKIVDVGKEVISCSKDGTVKLWNCGRGECERTWAPEHGECTSLALSPDLTNVAVACSLKKIAFFSACSEETLLTVTTPGSPSSISFSPCGTRIVCGDDDGSISVFNVNDGYSILHLKTNRGRVEKIAWRSDGIFVAYHNGTVAVYDANDFEAHAKFELSGGDCDPIYDFCFHEDTIFTACRDKYIRKYRLQNL